jgi:hypothetical protein
VLKAIVKLKSTVFRVSLACKVRRCVNVTVALNADTRVIFPLLLSMENWPLSFPPVKIK